MTRRKLAKSWTARSFEIVAAVYDCRIAFFQLFAKSLTAKSWGDELESEGLVVLRKTTPRRS
jgi:hypothetical protein